MEASGHFIFELLKIGILAAVYAFVIFSVIRLINKSLKDTRPKKKFTFDRIYKVSYLILFVYMFTYWGNHGLGDEYYVPIGHWKAINQGDLTCYIDAGKQQYMIQDFIVDNGKFFGRYDQSKDNDIIGDFIIWDLKSDSITSVDESKYLMMVDKNHYPSTQTFKKFDWHYSNYWNGWRFWLLP